MVQNDSIAQIAALIYENGGAVGSAGHGAVSLINIKLKNGSYLVSATKLTCFPKSISAKWLPIDWEQELIKRGATVVLPSSAVEKDQGVQLIDRQKRIISGSYAENAQWVAIQMIEMMLRSKNQ